MIGRDDGLGDPGDGAEGRGEPGGALDHVRVGHVGHLLDVGAGGEDPLPAVDARPRDVVPLGGLERRGADLLLHLHVERVHLRAVDPDRADAVLHLEPYELAHPRPFSLVCRSAPSRAIRPVLPPGPGPWTRIGRVPTTNTWRWSAPDQFAPVWPGYAPAARRDVDRAVDELRGPLARVDRCLGLPLRRGRPRDAPPADRAHPGRLARRAARRRRSGSATASASTDRGRRDHGHAVQPAQAPARPLRQGAAPAASHRARGAARRTTPPTRAGAARSTRRLRAAQRGRARRLRLGRATPSCGTGGATRSSTSCTSRASPSCTTGCPSTCAAPTPAWPPTRSLDYLRRPGGDRGRAAARPALPHRARAGRARLSNYWGYNSIGFFAPHAAYSSAGDRGEQVTEFKEMVRRFHARRPRGHPRRGLQPHRRGRGRRADVLLPRAGRLRHLQAARTPPRTPTGTSPAAATPSTPPTAARCG